MPKLFVLYGYQISIWSNENNEPIHVHVSKKRPTANSTKLWLLSNGTFIRADVNDNRIPSNILNKIINKLNLVAPDVLNYWKAYHGYIKFYK